MADFKKAINEVFKLEFNSPVNALHTNVGEVGYTFCGVYQKANPKWSGWKIIEETVKKHKGDIKKASAECFANTSLVDSCKSVYEANYWTPYKLGELTQTAAEEIFVFGVNTGMPTAIKKAQKLAGVTQDGKVGPATIKAINSINESVFDMKFDQEEIAHYAELIAKRPAFKQFEKGWKNRAVAV